MAIRPRVLTVYGRRVECPRCGALEYHACKGKNGQWLRSNHDERIAKFLRSGIPQTAGWVEQGATPC